MTIDEAKKLLPVELKYPLPDGTIDNLLGIQRIAIDMSEPDDIDNLLGIQRIAIDMSEPDEKGMHYAMMAALIELKERRNGGSYNSNAREDFMHIVYNELSDDADNCRANRIIDAADEYADNFRERGEGGREND